MFRITNLDIGDQVTIVCRRRHYVTVVQDQPQPDLIVVAQPTLQGVPLRIDEHDMAEVVFKRKELGVLSFQAFQVARVNTDGVPLLHLQAVTPVERRQLRNFFRLDKVLPAQLETADPNDPQNTLTVSAYTVNLSGGGCRLAPSRPLDYGMQVTCSIELAGERVDATGEIVWVEPTHEPGRAPLVGVRFGRDCEAARRKIVTYVTGEQRKLLSERKR